MVESANLAATVGGRMRFVRMRILEAPGTDPACCSVEEYGPVFRARANQIVTVPLGFRMEWVADEGTQILSNDWIGLEVLDPGVPIPGIWTQGGGPDLTLPTYLWLPSFSERGLQAPTQNLRSEGSYSGFVPAWSLNYRQELP